MSGELLSLFLFRCVVVLFDQQILELCHIAVVRVFFLLVLVGCLTTRGKKLVQRVRSLAVAYNTHAYYV